MGVQMPVPKSQGEATRTLLRDTVLKKLRSAILDGTFEPGERLHDDQLENWLGVSRTPVRDALNELSRAGLVEMSPNRYTRVAEPVEEEALAALQTLGVMLGGVARLAVPRLTPSTKKNVLKQLRIVIELLRGGEAHRTNIEATVLWRMLTQECGNPILINLCEQTLDGLAFKLRVATVTQIFDFHTIADLFEELAACIDAGDAVGAEMAIERAHLLPSGDGTQQAL